LNLTILIIILLLNVWSIFVKSTCGETVEGFKGNGLKTKINEIHSKIEIMDANVKLSMDMLNYVRYGLITAGVIQ
jgi:hypothetical protein